MGKQRRGEGMRGTVPQRPAKFEAAAEYNVAYYYGIRPGEYPIKMHRQRGHYELEEYLTSNDVE